MHHPLRFKQYLAELTSINDNNAIGGLLDRARHNLKAVAAKHKSLQPITADLVQALDALEKNPGRLYVDEYSMVDYIQRLINPKVDERTLKTVLDGLQSYDGDSES